jgi:PhnB protein
MAVKPIPDGMHTVTPYLIVSGAAKLIDFLKAAFGALETERVETPEGIRHAQVRIGDSPIMISDANQQWKPMPTTLHLYLTDVDKAYKNALAAGGKSLREPTNEFYGDRSAGVQDQWGNMWWMATHIEDVSPEEIERRMAAMSK